MSQLREQVAFQGISIITLPSDRQPRVQERLQESSVADSWIYPSDVCEHLQMNFLLFVEELSAEASITASNIWSNGKAQEEYISKPLSIM